jgi:hypothetical protein
VFETCGAVAEDGFSNHVFEEGTLPLIGLVSQIVEEIFSREAWTADNDATYP